MSDVEDSSVDEVMKIKPMSEAEMIKKISLADVPSNTVNYFSSHRFFIIKGFQCMGGP
jgi:hypothetical protein